MIDNAGYGRDDFTKSDGCTNAFIGRLYYVLSKVEFIQSFDTRASILDIVSTLITNHPGGGLPGTVEEIVGPLPSLWSASADQNLLRTSILTMLTEIVIAVGTTEASLSVQSQVLPLVQYATNKSQPESIYLADEGLTLCVSLFVVCCFVLCCVLDLTWLLLPSLSLLPLLPFLFLTHRWQKIMENMTTYTPDLHRSFQNILHLMHHDFEHTEVCMSIVDSYICGGGTVFLQEYSAGLRDMFNTSVGKVREPAALRINKSIVRIFII